jgi:hypothetical protein
MAECNAHATGGYRLRSRIYGSPVRARGVTPNVTWHLEDVLRQNPTPIADTFRGHQGDFKTSHKEHREHRERGDLLSCPLCSMWLFSAPVACEKGG